MDLAARTPPPSTSSPQGGGACPDPATGGESPTEAADDGHREAPPPRVMTPTPLDRGRRSPASGGLVASGGDGADCSGGHGGGNGGGVRGGGGGGVDGGSGGGGGGLLAAFSNLMTVLDRPPAAATSVAAAGGTGITNGGNSSRGGGESLLPNSFSVPDAGAPGLTAIDVMGIDTEAFGVGIPYQSPPPRIWAPATAGSGDPAGSGPSSSVAGLVGGVGGGGAASTGDGTSPPRRRRSSPPPPPAPPTVVPAGGGGLPPPPPPSPGDSSRDAGGGLFFSFASLLATTASAALEVLTREDASPSAGGSDDEGAPQGSVGGRGWGGSPSGGGSHGVLLPGAMDGGGGGHAPPRRRRSRAAALGALLNAPDVDLSALRAAAWPGLACAPRAGVWKLLLGYAPCNAARRRAALGRKRGEYRAAVEQHCGGWRPLGGAGDAEAGKSSSGTRDGVRSGGGSRPEPGSVTDGAAGGGASRGGQVGGGGGTPSPPATDIEDEDASTRRQVAVDVPRTCPGLPLFHVDSVAAAMERVLYVWAVRHPACGYVQGMNDLVTPFFAVFLAEHATPGAEEGSGGRRRRRQPGGGGSSGVGSGSVNRDGRSPLPPYYDGGSSGMANGVTVGDARAGKRSAARGAEEGETDGFGGSRSGDITGDDGDGRGGGASNSGPGRPREDIIDVAATGNSNGDSDDDDDKEAGAGGGGGVSIATLLSWSHLDASRLRPGAVAIAEADAYWCFSALLGSIQDHFTFAQPGIQVRVHYLSQLVHRVDRELADHLTAQGLDYMAFAFRWFNCLLMRELPFPLLVRLWDTCLAEVDGFSVFLVYVCAALLVRFRGELLDRDFQGMVMFLQALPTGEWDGRDLDMLLGQAYMWHTIFGSSPGRIHRT